MATVVSRSQSNRAPLEGDIGIMDVLMHSQLDGPLFVEQIQMQSYKVLQSLNKSHTLKITLHFQINHTVILTYTHANGSKL